MDAAEWEVLVHVRDALASAPHGTKDKVMAEGARLLGCSPGRVYARLKAAGFDSGRRRRADAGKTAMSAEEVRLIGGMLAAARRDNDKGLMPIDVAIDVAAASGRIQAPLSAGRVAHLMRRHQVHPSQIGAGTPALERQSLHPNHVWQIDSSTCVLYYMRSGHLASMDADQYYKNKPGNVARVLHDLCTRYAAVDHTSGAFKFRYALGGESAQNLVDFFLWAISKQDAAPMHGVPLVLMLDKGSGNTSNLVANLARNMRVRLIHHAAGNARATGSVEKTHDIIERHFEGRFRFLPAEQLTLDGINALGEQWAASFCATRVHSRHRQTRYGVWMQITPAQLRVIESIDAVRDLVSSEPETRRVDNTRCITFSIKGHGSLTYDLSLVPTALVASKVTVVVNLYRAPAIDVLVVDQATGEESWQTVEPLSRGAFGFRSDAPVIDQDMRIAAFTGADHARNRALQEAYRTPGEALPTIEEAAKARKAHAQAYQGVIDAMADVDATPVPSYLPRRGTPLETDVRLVEAVRLSVVAACARLKPILGDAYGPHVYAWLQARYGDEGVPEDALEAIAAQFLRPAASTHNEGGLRAAGGEA